MLSRWATTITWTATDKSTNEMMDTQVVTVVDTTKPDIAAPENITKEATGPTTPVTVGLATATDLVTDFGDHHPQPNGRCVCSRHPHHHLESGRWQRQHHHRRADHHHY